MRPMKMNEAFYDSSVEPGCYDVPTDVAFATRDVRWSTEPSYRSISSASEDVSESSTGSRAYNGFSHGAAHVYLLEHSHPETEFYALNNDRISKPSPADFLLEPYHTFPWDDMDDESCPFLKRETLESPGHANGTRTKYKEVSDDSTTQAKPKKQLACQICERRFTLKHDLARHLRTLHRRQHDYVYRCAVSGCTKAGKIFNRLDNFKKHLKTVHYKGRSDDMDHMVLESKLLNGEAFTVTTPEMYLHR